MGSQDPYPGSNTHRIPLGITKGPDPAQLTEAIIEALGTSTGYIFHSSGKRNQAKQIKSVKYATEINQDA